MEFSMSEISNKLYRVIFTDSQLESLGISVGDVCSQVEVFDEDGDALFKNLKWKSDGIWWLNKREVEELTETN